MKTFACKFPARSVLSTFLAFIFLVSISCSITGSPNQSAQQTIAALGVQQTLMAQQAGADLQATAQAADATRMAQEFQATLLAQQAAQLAAASEQPPGGEIQPPPSTSEEVPTTQEASVPADLDEKIKAAKILLFEDISGQQVFDVYPQFAGMYPTRYVKEALDMAGYSYVDVGSAQGWLKDNLLSTTKWDLIIVASEARTRISGEYFTYLLEHINRKSGVIIELWYLDWLSEGKIAPILSKCGVEYYKNWETTELALWPLVPDHPIFNTPNSGVSLRNYEPFWYGDHGDLLRSTGSGDGQLLLGTMATQKNNHGTLVSCEEGRLLLQTFCDHDFAQANIVPLWENYVYNVLKSKFLTAP